VRNAESLHAVGRIPAIYVLIKHFFCKIVILLLNIPAKFGIIQTANENLKFKICAGHAHKPLFGKKGKLLKISICNLWLLLRAYKAPGRSGLKWRDTRYEVLSAIRLTKYERLRTKK
jgi:hypothetical protein